MRNKEILNIDYHRKLLVLKALNTSPTKVEAAKRLGVCIRQIDRYIHSYQIQAYNRGNQRKYFLKQNTQVYADQN